MIKSYDDIHNIVTYPFTEEYLAWAKKMKD